MPTDKRVLLIISGGIAAYKSLDLIRRLRERGYSVRCIMTPAAEQFVTPMSVAALSGQQVYQSLFDLKDEAEMGHIQLSRDADLVVVAPATADLMSKMASGAASDLASTALLATDKPVMVAPAMNVRMWGHPATQANINLLKTRGVLFVGPNDGDMACGEFGPGRMSEPLEILAAVESFFADGPLTGKTALVTSGPTHEPIDPVRYIANRSSGKQGHAIAAALAALGADVTLVSGPVALETPAGVHLVAVETARDMLVACQSALPADIAVCASAVADWRVSQAADQKVKKTNSGVLPALELVENPDILATLSGLEKDRPALVIGFAAETESVLDHATQKRAGKGCDWIVANDVSPETGTFGGDSNTVHVIDDQGADSWSAMSKTEVATKLAARISEHFKDRS